MVHPFFAPRSSLAHHQSTSPSDAVDVASVETSASHQQHRAFHSTHSELVQGRRRGLAIRRHFFLFLVESLPVCKGPAKAKVHQNITMRGSSLTTVVGRPEKIPGSNPNGRSSSFSVCRIQQVRQSPLFTARRA